jgi:polar amino acid transport system permease protein
MQVWNWSGFWSYFVNPYLLGGAGVTIGLTVATLILGMILAFILVLFRMSNNPILQGYARFHVWLFRGTPLLVQLIIIYTGLPQLGLMRLDVLQSALLGLVLNEAAYLSEILRAGIESVPRGQNDAAKALGLNRTKAFVLITVPQAMRVVVPALGNSVNGLLKTTSIASVISMEELLRRGQVLMQQRFEVLEVFVCIAIIYLAMTSAWEMVQRRIEAHYAKAYAQVGDATKAQPTTDLARDDR